MVRKEQILVLCFVLCLEMVFGWCKQLVTKENRKKLFSAKFKYVKRNDKKLLTGTSGEVGSVTGSFTLSSVIGGNLVNDILVLGNRINLTDSSAALGDNLAMDSLQASMPSPASLVGDGIRCLTTKKKLNL